MPTSEKIILGTPENPVRLSFARLFTPEKFGARKGKADPNSKPRYEAVFLLDPENKEHAKTIERIKKLADEIALEEFDGEIPKKLARCYGDGDETDYDGYEGMFFISSHEYTKPTVVKAENGAYVRLEEEDGVPYSGCYVVGTITLWSQNNTYGKRINANLRAVRFVKDGEAFGRAPVDAEDEFGEPEDTDSLYD